MPAQNADGQTRKFVVFGDTPDPDIATITGHCPNLGNLSARIAGEGPDLVIYVGDLINGLGTTNASPVHGDFDTQFSNWKSAVQPIYDYQNSSGVPIYVAQGNHEVFWITQANTTLVDSYMRNIGSLMLQNGPSTEAGLTYWVRHKGAEFISLDQYRAPNVVDMGTVNQSWLDQRLASDSSEFTFVWGHTPAYASVGTAPSLYLNTTERDAFWSSLENNNVTAYFCGHVQNYARGNANGTWEVLVGNGGATAQPITPSFLPTSINDTYPNLSTGNWTADDGYLLVTIDGAAGTAHAQLKDARLGQRHMVRWGFVHHAGRQLSCGHRCPDRLFVAHRHIFANPAFGMDRRCRDLQAPQRLSRDDLKGKPGNLVNMRGMTGLDQMVRPFPGCSEFRDPADRLDISSGDVIHESW